ncbi:MAG: helix-turn-helix domain-containing protein [Proteobacteria bacterium]|nr:helix-turn-helix domain-containing protein [Pseudomonadota bacterium]
MIKQQSLGELIIERREAALLSVEGLAEAMGLAANTVYRHQAGDNIPHIGTVGEYCRVLKIDKAMATAALIESRLRAAK